MKKLFLILSFLFSFIFVQAQNSGFGCKIGHEYLYTDYLGKAPAYVGTAPIHYFRSNGNRIPFYWGYGFNQHQGYRCGYINVYPSSSYYDYKTGKNIQIPSEQEFTSLGEQCVIAPSLGAPPVATDTYGRYSYNKTNKCGGDSETNVPLDDYIPILLLGVGFIGYYFLKTQAIV